MLITKFVGSAWEKIFSSPHYQPSAFFARTGCLLTLDGSEDNRINIEGAPAYKPPAPARDGSADDEQDLLIAEANPTGDEQEADSEVTDDSISDRD